MPIRVAIHGFGRMGRLGLRAGWGHPSLDFVQINEIQGDAACHAHLLEFDSVHGRWDREIGSRPDALLLGDREIAFTGVASPEKLDLGARGIDLVIECTGRFKTREALGPFFEQGVRKVLISSPAPEPALNLVYGVNDHLYDSERHHIVTAASCTTNCLAPLVKVLHEKIGIERGCMTTIHDVTNTQTIVDKGHRDLRRARACGESLIPTTTGSARAITEIFPELEGRLNGHAVRVPLLNASLTDFVFEASRTVTVEEVNGLLREAAGAELAGILAYEERPLVSVDFRGNPHSSIVDAPMTMVVDGNLVKVYAWYDNEWGYVNRMVDLAALIAGSLAA